MLTPTICRMKVEAPRLAAAAKPGQFLIVRADEKGERIPLTISDYDAEEGTVYVCFKDQLQVFLRQIIDLGVIPDGSTVYEDVQ